MTDAIINIHALECTNWCRQHCCDIRIADYLADDRLLYIADRLALEWRVLGKCLGLTNNRMDMIEWDCPLNAKQDQICLAMLKAWRDEDRGKVSAVMTEGSA